MADPPRPAPSLSPGSRNAGAPPTRGRWIDRGTPAARQLGRRGLLRLADRLVGGRATAAWPVPDPGASRGAGERQEHPGPDLPRPDRSVDGAAAHHPHQRARPDDHGHQQLGARLRQPLGNQGWAFRCAVPTRHRRRIRDAGAVHRFRRDHLLRIPPRHPERHRGGGAAAGPHRPVSDPLPSDDR